MTKVNRYLERLSDDCFAIAKRLNDISADLWSKQRRDGPDTKDAQLDIERQAQDIEAVGRALHKAAISYDEEHAT